jgi:cell division protein FtsQ
MAEGRKPPSQRFVFALVALLTVAAVVVCGCVFWLSPVFALAEVEVSGVKLLSKAEVVAASGVVLGTPQPLVDTAAVADRVAGLPAVAKVQVNRIWPDKLEIAIAERVARMEIPYYSGYLFADASGVVFDGGTKAKSLLRVVAAQDNSRLLQDCLRVSEALSPATVKKFSYISAQSMDSITLHLDKGVIVNWGTAEQSALKSQVLDALLKQAGRHYDVSVPASPTVR